MTARRTSNIGLLCSVDDCDAPRRKREWCANHYAQWARYGEIRPYAYRWAAEKRCLVCGATDWPGKGRSTCSAACKQMLSRHGGPPPNPDCVRCGVEIDLTAIGKGGKRKRADTKLCRQCKAVHNRHWMTAGEIALRDGTDCRLCGEPVDMTLRRPSRDGPSVDHIVPRSLGGSDDPENLQLAHLRCNWIKSDRTDPGVYAAQLVTASGGVTL